jgi:hypothetical protein
MTSQAGRVGRGRRHPQRINRSGKGLIHPRLNPGRIAFRGQIKRVDRVPASRLFPSRLP